LFDVVAGDGFATAAVLMETAARTTPDPRTHRP
jgi:hypothetical protein